MCIPWIAEFAGVLWLVAVTDTDVQLDQLAGDTESDQDCAEQCNVQVRHPLRVGAGVQTTGHAHEAQCIERHEGHEEADAPEPERCLAPLLVQFEAERFREVEAEACDVTEYCAADDHVMEVSNNEQAVVQYEVSTRDGQQYASHAADGEGHHEAQGPQNLAGEAQTALVDGEQPVEQLHPRRDRNQHRRQTEEGVDAGPRTHGEEVVQPNHEAQYRDRAGGVDHRVVTEQTLAGERGDNFGEDTERRQNEDVHLRVTPRPEQVDVHHWIATKFIGENVEIHVTVKCQQCQGSGQDRERSHDQDVCPGAGPGEDRHVHQFHARGTHLQNGRQEVNPG